MSSSSSELQRILKKLKRPSTSSEAENINCSEKMSEVTKAGIRNFENLINKNHEDIDRYCAEREAVVQEIEDKQKWLDEQIKYAKIFIRNKTTHINNLDSRIRHVEQDSACKQRWIDEMNAKYGANE